MRISPPRVRELLNAARRSRILVIGDVMLDQFIWGKVSRISPEAPVPVVDFERESFVPGGAANVARNLSAFGAKVELFGAVGSDAAGKQLEQLLKAEAITCDGLAKLPGRMTTQKSRLIAHQQQIARVDRETRRDLDAATTDFLLGAIEARLRDAQAVVVGDYGKGVITQTLLDELKSLCHERGVWLSLDPKPAHDLDLTGLSLLTPNRKEMFELVEKLGGRSFATVESPIQPGSLRGPSVHTQSSSHSGAARPDGSVLQAAAKLLEALRPALLLVTLGDQGMLLCQRGKEPFHIPTVARAVFDVSGAGDTVIAAFTLAVAAGSSPVEAALISNHAAGVVVGKVGTATVTPAELIECLSND